MNKRQILSLALAMLAGVVGWQTQVNAEGPAVGGYDYYVDISSKRPKPSDAKQNIEWKKDLIPQAPREYFNYKGSDLTDVTHIWINYQEGNTDDVKTTKPIEYEELWYSRGRALGLARLHTLGLDPGTQGAIRINHDQKGSLSYSETRSLVNAAMRVMLDAYKNGNQVTAVVVPASSFNLISQAFQDHHFLVSSEDPEQGIEMAAITLALVSEPDGTSQTLIYPRQ